MKSIKSNFSISMVPAIFLFSIFIFSFASGEEEKPVESEMQIIQNAQKLLQQGNEDASIQQLEASLSRLDESKQIKVFFADLLASQAMNLSKGQSYASLSTELSESVESCLRRARDLVPESVDRWRPYLQFLSDRCDQESTFVFESQDFLLKHYSRASQMSFSLWLPILHKMNVAFDTFDFPVYRLEVLEMLMLDKLTGSEAAKLIPLVQKSIRNRLKEIIDKIEADIAFGEVLEAEAFLRGLKKVEPNLPKIEALSVKLELAKKLQNLLVQIHQAMGKSEFQKAEDLCQEVFKIDSNNPHAKLYLLEIKAQRKDSHSPAIGEKKRLEMQKEKLQKKLLIAESEEDLLLIRNLLRELSLLGFASKEHFKRLREVERELFESRLHSRERFENAKTFLNLGKWLELRRLLNRNPAFAESLDQFILVWEMRLVSDYNLSLKTDEELLVEADRIFSKSPKSFWAAFVNLGISLSAKNYLQAEKFLEQAQAASPKHPALRWPSRILWVWRNGWKIVPFILLIFFYILSKFMSVFFNWWEEFYWKRISFTARLFPRWAMASLEKKFGVTKDPETRARMFELLSSCAFAAGDSVKGIRYTELFLEINPGSLSARDVIAKHYLQQAKLKPEQLDCVVDYLKRNSKDAPSLKKVVNFIIGSKLVGPKYMGLIYQYLSAFPDNSDAVIALGDFYSSSDLSDAPIEALNIIERAWGVSKDSKYLTALFKALILKGLFDRLKTVFSDAQKKGQKTDHMSFFETIDKEMELTLNNLLKDLGGIDKKLTLKTLQKITKVQYLNGSHLAQILPQLESLSDEKEQNIGNLTRKAIEQFKATVEKGNKLKESLGKT
ncbi:hypothetical protein HYY75_08115 [bacterium]|nr:hypothetical protein [bacterium]